MDYSKELYLLAPLLFALYTNDLLKESISHEPGRGIHAYADDLVLYSSGNKTKMNNDMQAMITVAEQYLFKWKQKINPAKCEAVLFKQALNIGPPNFRRNWKKFQVCINGQTIQSTCVIYRGIYLKNLNN